MMGKGGKPKPMGTAMIEAGYGKGYAKNPKKFESTKDWQELLDEYLPIDVLAAKHLQLLHSSQIQNFIFPTEKGKKAISDKEIKFIVENIPGCRLIYIKPERMLGGKVAYFQSPDNRSQDSALEKAYKLHGKYAPEQIEITKRKYANLSDEELAERIKKAQAKLSKKD